MQIATQSMPVGTSLLKLRCFLAAGMIGPELPEPLLSWSPGPQRQGTKDKDPAWASL